MITGSLLSWDYTLFIYNILFNFCQVYSARCLDYYLLFLNFDFRTGEKLQTASVTEDTDRAPLKCLLCMCTLDTALGEYFTG